MIDLCTNCGRATEFNVGLERVGLVVCPGCGAGYRKLKGDAKKHKAQHAAVRPVDDYDLEDIKDDSAVPKPINFSMGTNDELLVITCRWRPTRLLYPMPLTILSAVLLLLLLVNAIPILTSDVGVSSTWNLAKALLILIPLMFITGIASLPGLVYYLRTTRIMADANEITVQSGPLPGGRITVNRSDVATIFSRLKTRHPKGLYAIYNYDVYATLKDGRRIRLVGRLPRPDQALYIEQQLENWINLSNHNPGKADGVEDVEVVPA